MKYQSTSKGKLRRPILFGITKSYQYKKIQNLHSVHIHTRFFLSPLAKKEYKKLMIKNKQKNIKKGRNKNVVVFNGLCRCRRPPCRPFPIASSFNSQNPQSQNYFPFPTYPLTLLHPSSFFPFLFFYR